MADPLSDKAIAQAFREAVRDWNTEAHWHIVHASIQERARELSAASHGEDEARVEAAAANAIAREDSGYSADELNADTRRRYYRMARAALAAKDRP